MKTFQRRFLAFILAIAPLLARDQRAREWRPVLWKWSCVQNNWRYTYGECHLYWETFFGFNCRNVRDNPQMSSADKSMHYFRRDSMHWNLLLSQLLDALKFAFFILKPKGNYQQLKVHVSTEKQRKQYSFLFFHIVDACDSQPCHNGASCKITGNNTYECQCAARYFGPNCENGKGVM